ncbi:MAG: zinc-dependent dehydrogenase [Planctomycetota bacterium]|nr:zinc-dependent dehydrogenase [Planctomycetota bacterium]MDI6787573.1 zinc-dependent dehydrogenase [Planctomycetota bacterium]
MRVAIYYNNKDIRLDEMPKPQPAPGELVMRVEASGICGSDVLEWYRLKKAPLVLGHEVAGVVEEVGHGVIAYKKGDRIAAAHHVPCNTCHYCLNGHHTVCDTLRQTNFYPGGFAEYVRLPAINVGRGVFRLPDEVSFEEATFIEPLSCVLRGQRLAGLKPGQNVIVIGAGISGLLHIKSAVASGAGKIFATDINPYRLNIAKRVGADVVINAGEDIPSHLKERNQGRLADMVILCTGAISALKQALSSVERGGTVLLFASPDEEEVSIPIRKLFFRNEITLTSSYAGNQSDHLVALELIRSRRVTVKDIITHRFPLAETVKGFQLTAQPDNSIKVIIEPQK